jgi:hypothetical protein
MYNYNQEVYRAEQERMVRMMIASQRQVPYEFRRNAFRQATSWLSKNVGGPVGSVWSTNYSRVSSMLIVGYRRASTRAAGLVLNTLEGLLGVATER